MEALKPMSESANNFEFFRGTLGVAQWLPRHLARTWCQLVTGCLFKGCAPGADGKLIFRRWPCFLCGKHASLLHLVGHYLEDPERTRGCKWNKETLSKFLQSITHMRTALEATSFKYQDQRAAGAGSIGSPEATLSSR